MMRTKTLENQIRIREGFDVRINPRSRSLQSYFDLFPERGAPKRWTVRRWKDSRFYPNYEGFEVSVLLGDATEAPGVMGLRRVRESYYEESA